MLQMVSLQYQQMTEVLLEMLQTCPSSERSVSNPYMTFEAQKGLIVGPMVLHYHRSCSYRIALVNQHFSNKNVSPCFYISIVTCELISRKEFSLTIKSNTILIQDRRRRFQIDIWR